LEWAYQEDTLRESAPCSSRARSKAPRGAARGGQDRTGPGWLRGPGRRADLHEDVQRGLRDDARVERARERRVIDYAAARHVHHARAALHLGECRIAEDALRAGARG